MLLGEWDEDVVVVGEIDNATSFMASIGVALVLEQNILLCKWVSI